MNTKLFCLFVLLIASCQDSSSNDKDKIDSSNLKKQTYRPLTTTDTTGFLSGCQKWVGGIYQGYLQGVDVAKDSLGPFGFYENYDSSRSFSIIFIHKNQKPIDPNSFIWKDFENGCNNNYQYFNCFAFVYPMRD